MNCSLLSWSEMKIVRKKVSFTDNVFVSGPLVRKKACSADKQSNGRSFVRRLVSSADRCGGMGLKQFLFADCSDEFLEIEWFEVGYVFESARSVGLKGRG